MDRWQRREYCHHERSRIEQEVAQLLLRCALYQQAPVFSGHVCGFIGFMSRIDADRAMAGLAGLVIRGDPVKFSLAKPVHIPDTVSHLSMNHHIYE